jgi:hypothetical protein
MTEGKYFEFICVETLQPDAKILEEVYAKHPFNRTDLCKPEDVIFGN